MIDVDRHRLAGPRAGPAGDDSRSGGGHHHLACRGCGAIAGADCATPHSACLHRVSGAGFTVEDAEVTFWGLCPRCRRSPAAT